jgi:predicted DNA-binding transcriptional regulator AlpA
MEPLLLSRKEMLRVLDMSLTSFKRFLKTSVGKTFPLPVKMGESLVWKRSEVVAFVELLPRLAQNQDE